MLFPTLAFHAFFLIVFALNWALRRSQDWRQIMLLVFSWGFYASFDPRLVVLLLASAFFNWGVGSLIVAQPARGKGWMIAGVAINLLVLAAFKYYGFFASGANALLAGQGVGLPVIDIILPIGVSFFTFQGISYVVDVWQGRSKPARLLELSVLMSFFPHLVAGPIVRPSHLLPQLRERPWISRGTVATSMVLILWGLFKKAVIANELALHLVDPVFKTPSAHSALDLVIAAYGYAIQIYCDFSAYTDMAIGLAGLLGFRFPRNFNQPYRATSLQDFWRRWHISLSSWLRDYLYIGVLGGSRQAAWRICLALFMTMVLGGLWHGASLNFVIWGALHGGVLVIERVWQMIRPKAWPGVPAWLGWLVTFHVVTVGWIFFRCAQFDDATAFLGRIATWQGGTWQGGTLLASPWTVGMIAIGMLCQFGPPDAIQRIALRLRDLPFWVVGLLGTLALLVVEGLRGAGVAPFIYFQF